MELVDTLVLGTSVARREGSSPFSPTRIDNRLINQCSKGLLPSVRRSFFVSCFYLLKVNRVLCNVIK